MKFIYLLILITIVSCDQQMKKSATETTQIAHNQETIHDEENSLDTLSEVAEGAEKISEYKIMGSNFKEALKALPLQQLPILATTNYDSYIDEDDINPVDPEAFRLPLIYENWYEVGYYYRVYSAYRIRLSDSFHTVVITCKKGDAEIESRLINYTLEGKPIDHEVVAYDEIAEGWSQVVSKISKKNITVNRIFWSELKQVTQISYTIAEDGNIKEIATDKLHESIDGYVLVNSILMDLKLEWAQIAVEYLLVAELSQVTNETLVIIPEIAEEDEDLLRLNTHMILTNPHSGVITHQLFETYEENGWQSDAIAIESIDLDPLAYRINDHEKAFGIIINFKNNSQPNPYREEVLSLYSKDKNRLKRLLNQYTMYKSMGEVNVNSCYAHFDIIEKELALDTSKTAGFFDINVTTNITQRVFSEDENGVCTPTDTILSTQTSILTYNGKGYQEKN
tara:strand:+ start:5548 stop:6903 length:1356 start_codon:yes stop_codon:yes gene_type:complete